METETPDAAPAPVAHPAGEYAIVEVLGHRTIVGRIAEVERFGAKMLGIEPIWKDGLLPLVLIGGTSIYQVTSCSAETAFARQPKYNHQLPPSIAATVPIDPPAALPAPDDDEDICEDSGNFHALCDCVKS